MYRNQTKLSALYEFYPTKWIVYSDGINFGFGIVDLIEIFLGIDINKVKGKGTQQCFILNKYTFINNIG